MSLHIKLSLIDTDNDGKISVTGVFPDEEEKLLRGQPSLCSFTAEELFELFVHDLGGRMLRHVCTYGLPRHP